MNAESEKKLIEFNNKFNNYNLFKIYLFLSFIWDMIWTAYLNMDSKLKNPIIQLQTLIENKYNLLIKSNNFNEDIFTDEKIKNIIIDS